MLINQVKNVKPSSVGSTAYNNKCVFYTLRTANNFIPTHHLPIHESLKWWRDSHLIPGWVDY